MKKQLMGLGLILFGMLLILANINGIVRIPLLGDLLAVNDMGLIAGIAGLCIVIYGAFKKDKT